MLTAWNKDGEPTTLASEDGRRLATVPVPFDLQMALFGNLAGRTAKVERIVGQRRLGWVSSAALNDIGSHLTNLVALFVFPTPGEQINMVSTSINDSAAGVGTRTVRLTYLNMGGIQTQKFVTTNGTTPVNCGTDISFIQRAESWTHGSAGVTQGDITFTNVAGTSIYESIRNNENNSKSARYKVPDNKLAYLMTMSGASINADMDTRVRGQVDLDTGNLTSAFHPLINAYIAKDVPFHRDARFIPIAPGAIVKAAAFPATTGAGVRCDITFDLLIVDIDP